MQTDTISIEQFLSDNRITMTAERVDRNPNMPDSNGMDHWKCVFTRHFTTDALYTNMTTGESRPRTYTARMTTYFSMGYGHKGKEPGAADVLDCLASDSSSVSDSLEDWCSNYGYDTDSRKAERTYKACVHAASRLKTFLGDAAYETLVYNTERL